MTFAALAREKEKDMVKIVVDAMGGDNAPEEIVKGALLALRERENFSVLFTGDEARIRAELAKTPHDSARVEVRHCTEEITNDDVPTHAIRSKRDSSLVVGMTLLKEDPEAAAFVSAGSTGAVLTGGIMLIGRIKGVLRPALCPGIPNVRGSRTLLCDCGANAECKPSMLCQFALMGSAYSTVGLGVKQPKVGLLNNGAEEHKGDPVHQQAYKYLKQMKGINFVGNIEGRDINTADIDVVVSDGFSGNIALKTMEGTAKMILKTMKKQLMADTRSKIGALLCKKAINRMRADLDFEAAGGAMLLGVKKVVVKNHGSSSAISICNAVHKAAQLYRSGLIQKVESLIEQADLSSVIDNGDE